MLSFFRRFNIAITSRPTRIPRRIEDDGNPETGRLLRTVEVVEVVEVVIVTVPVKG